MKDNTGAKELEKLFKATEDPVYKHLVEIGRLKKLYGTYYRAGDFVMALSTLLLGLLILVLASFPAWTQIFKTPPSILTLRKNSEGVFVLSQTTTH